MTREQFEAALVKPPTTNQGEAIFDFSQLTTAPCRSFSHVLAVDWETRDQILEECWQAYLAEFEMEWME